jgi:hypothetical protein
MEKLQKDFLEIVEVFASEVEQFFVGVAESVDALFEISEEIAEQWQSAIATEVEFYLNELSEPILEVYWELEEMDRTFPYTVEPTLEQNPACIGCRHYHGQVYGSHLLVCGMHPYGWEDRHCPDWER